ncbi:MAG: hypothetical protein JNJ76_00540 [Candidatus Competibacter sp.]|nr:hypothetical protein [Candidatus Competibacter sp.]
MTLLIAWIGADTHGTSSIYLSADSRISWGDGTQFDLGRKVFAFNHWPDILGYCGDVMFPAIALSQIVDLADAGLLFQPAFSCKQKFQAIVDKLNDLFRQYPHQNKSITADGLTVVHASRDPEDNHKFFCHEITWKRDVGWSGTECRLPDSSRVLFSLGSGASEFAENYGRYEVGPNRDTSRAVFHCFCDTLAKTSMASVGGAPQVVGIYRKPNSPAFALGVIYGGKRYFLGAHIDNVARHQAIEWRNINFERCDGRTMELIRHAQPQPDPLRRL